MTSLGKFPPLLFFFFFSCSSLGGKNLGNKHDLQLQFLVLFFSPSTHKSRSPVCFQVLPKFKSLTQCQPSGALKGLPLRPEFAHRCCYTPLPQRHLPDQSVSAVAARASRYVGKGKYLPLSRRGWSKDPKQLQVITDLRLEAN